MQVAMASDRHATLGAHPVGLATKGQPGLRMRLQDALKQAQRRGDKRATSTIRLILAALRDRDVAAQNRGEVSRVSDDEIGRLLRTMIQQRVESRGIYEQAGRVELAQQEQEEIDVIEGFLPPRMDRAAVERAVLAVLEEAGATCIKDLGRTMALLRERHGDALDGRMASALLKRHLCT